MLWYLHLASNAGIIVHAYEDQPLAIGETSASGAGRFVSAELRPTIEVEFGADLALADRIHQDVHRYCFIARSVNFPVTYVANYRFRSEEHTSELQSLMRISYAVFCLKKKNKNYNKSKHN